MKYNKLYIPQGSQEWLDWRKQGIGASEIATIAELNPYGSRQAVLEEKLGRFQNKVETPAMKHGKHAEEGVRKLIESHPSWVDADFPLFVLETPLIEHGTHSYMRASLDGYVEDQKILVEIKCPSSPRVINSCYKGNIPAYWIAQVQWQLHILGWESGYLFVFPKGAREPIREHVLYNEEQANYLVNEAKKFWKEVEDAKS